MLTAAVALILTLPIILVIAVFVKLSSPGPVFYSQTRIGMDRRRDLNGNANLRRRTDLGGRPFVIYKFRTMRASTRNGDEQVWARPDDPRVTPVGRILRQYRLDELPQLFNVLRGDMNMVGPRPEQPKIFAQLRHTMERYAERQQVLPGITGWAQVRHHYDTSVEDAGRKLAFDLEYVRRRSALEDLKILLMTLPVVVLRKGAW